MYSAASADHLRAGSGVQTILQAELIKTLKTWVDCFE